MDALIEAGVIPENMYQDFSSGNGGLFGIFAALAEAEFERSLISERTKAGLDAARARGRKGGAPYKMTAVKLRLAQAAMEKHETNVSEFRILYSPQLQPLSSQAGSGWVVQAIKNRYSRADFLVYRFGRVAVKDDPLRQSPPSLRQSAWREFPHTDRVALR